MRFPTPAPETLQEVRVNASMYDAQQGSASGAHIDMSTGSGTNAIHGSLYGRRGTNWINAAPFFFKNNTGIPDSRQESRVAPLHRGWHRRRTDHQGQALLLRRLPAPACFRSGDRRYPDCRSARAQRYQPNRRRTGGDCQQILGDTDAENGFQVGPSDWANNPVGLALFQAKLPNGQWLIPNDNGHIPDPLSPSNAFRDRHVILHSRPGRCRRRLERLAERSVSPSSTTTSTIPTGPRMQPPVSPDSRCTWIPASQVASINNVQTIRPNLSLTETFGYLREKAYNTNEQPWSPGQSGTPVADMTTSFGSYFPGITIVDALGSYGSSLGLPQRDAEYRTRRSESGPLHRRLPEPLHAVGQCHLDEGQSLRHLWWKLCLYAAQRPRSTHRQGQCS